MTYYQELTMKQPRNIQITHFVSPDQPFSNIQKAAMAEVGPYLERFIRQAEREDIYFTVNAFRDHAKGRMLYHGLNAHCTKNMPGAARVKLASRYKALGEELHRILQIAVQFNLIVRMESDTTRVYNTHAERPIVIEFRASVKRD